MKKVLLFSILSLALLQCSKSDDGGGGVPGAGLPELTPTQKARVTSFNGSLTTISAIRTSKLNRNASQRFLAMSSSKSSSSQYNKAQKELLDKLEWAENNRYCQNTVSVSQPQNQDTMYMPSSILEIAGFDCPINYKMESTSTLLGETANSASLQMNTTERFLLKDESEIGSALLVLDLDILEYNAQSKFNMTMSGNDNSLNISINGTGSMTANSASMGAVLANLAVAGSVNMAFNSSSGASTTNVNMNITVTQKFTDFSAVGFVKMNTSFVDDFENSKSTEKIEFFINGLTVTESEFLRVFGDIFASLPDFETETGTGTETGIEVDSELEF